MAHTAAGVVAGAVVLLATRGRDDVVTPPADAIALSSPQLPAAAQRGPALPWAPASPTDQPATDGAGGGPRATGRIPSRPPRAPDPLQGGDALSRVEARLWRAAIVTLTSGRGDAARLLLEQHRRAFPRGVYAGDREELMRRLRDSARPQ
ncbi:MAG TPA: hypothetical protein VL242_53800 [Sorangium sp.]|nr:hypothetical protein [Sorangium sp.]